MIKLSRSRWLALVIAAIIAIDWITKAIVQQRLPLYDRRPLIEGLLSFMHTMNPGISWGFFKNLPEAVRLPLIALLTLVGIGVAVWMMWDTRDRWQQIAGALGNLGDRLVNGGVTDFIYVHFFPYIFNFADISITIGGVILAARMLLDRPAADASTPTHA
ncbi:signal peptidase II [Longimicrobium sp.]|jgi:signal peptidase II|uniref:signal peptidase II n=1 Tax=Longimicrobium sp. TaxID=2029185 RepID=UPI002F94F513